VKQSKGHVKIYAEVGEVTTVKIYLQRLVAEGLDEEVTQSSPISEAGVGEFVFVVEDDPDVRGIFCRVSARAGFMIRLRPPTSEM
jgi:hypothetical protein